MNKVYVCPEEKILLKEIDAGLIKYDGTLYPYINGYNNCIIPDFSNAEEKEMLFSNMYDQKNSVEIYQNFLDWLLETFNENEFDFRKKLIKKLNLSKGYKVLITACGLGSDIQPIIDIFGSDGEIYVSDLSTEMVVASSRLNNSKNQNIHFLVCNAQNTPFQNDFFDAVFHFGGINLFDDVTAAIKEMERVVKPGGKVVFGDEGIAPWLKNTEYGNVAIHNNKLWGLSAPINILPRNAMDVNISWVLGNCFYLIDFSVSSIGPFMNIDVQNKGTRGGTMRTRYFGQLEGVTEITKKKVREAASKKGISVHEWLENLCNKELGKN